MSTGTEAVLLLVGYLVVSRVIWLAVIWHERRNYEQKVSERRDEDIR